MSLLLDFVYLIAVVLGSPWILYRLFVTGDWRSVPKRLGHGLGAPSRDSIWLHGSSAGEVAVLKPLIALFERDMPTTEFIVSAYTSTGLAAARAAYPRHRVVAFPLDFSFVVKRFLNRFEPRLIVIVESEFWPNLLAEARRRNISTAVVNGKMSQKSYRVHSRTAVVPRALRSLTLIAAQSEEHAMRLRALGVDDERISVTGNMKYDLAPAVGDPDGAGQLRQSLRYGADEIVIIGGSLHRGEDEALLDARLALDSAEHVSLILVPRYPADVPLVKQHVEARGYRAVLKTAVDRGEAAAPGHGGVLVVDTVGQLGDLYRAADVAFVGGSLYYRGANKGGHNLMEPAVFGVPVLFGPYNFSFRETVDDLLDSDAGVMVADGSELASAIGNLVRAPGRRREMGQRARDAVLRGQGATLRNYEMIKALLAGEGAQLQGIAVNRTMPRAATDPDPS
ncbi:3-deoxy-D-manno-octulosonic acid transferase [Candidatus Rariloculus sp.]|uniref:3-deoxy-D-manno-octulosonic acid transferase n=1 Tax=Candidatus Rariloculus sp. TaxID=3101265 RepID=UPI003D10DDC8